MKRFICLFLITVLLLPMSVGIFAHDNEYTFVIGDEEITISGALTEDEAYEIAQIHYALENDIDIPDTYASCSHRYEYQEVTATTHRARVTQPRCQKFLYNIGRCTKCYDTTTTLLETWYVPCCD